MKIIAAFAVGLALAGMLSVAPAQAQNTRTFVSPTGSDSNNCILAFPCRTFQAALALTNAGGEIAVLGTAGYGTLTISKAISIVNPGAFEAGIIVPSGGVGIVINAGPTEAVSLRGLTIEGGGVGQTGIVFDTGASLTIEDCVIHHVTVNGIEFRPNATTNLLVSKTLVADNGNYGIFFVPTGSGTVTAVFNRVEVIHNGNVGIYVDGEASTGTINATASDSVAARNATGFAVFSATGHAQTTLSLFHSVAADNFNGIIAQTTNAGLRIAQSMVTGNSTAGWQVLSGGVIATYQDSYINGNGANVGSLTPINKQ
jgi:Right handed beta helix region